MPLAPCAHDEGVCHPHCAQADELAARPPGQGKLAAVSRQLLERMAAHPRRAAQLMRRHADSVDRYARVCSRKAWRRALQEIGVGDIDEGCTAALLANCESNGNIDYRHFCRVWQR